MSDMWLAAKLIHPRGKLVGVSKRGAAACAALCVLLSSAAGADTDRGGETPRGLPWYDPNREHLRVHLNMETAQEGVTDDVSGHEHDGVLLGTGGPTRQLISVNGNGVSNHAFSFDGDDYMACGPPMDFRGTTFSVCLWVRTSGHFDQGNVWNVFVSQTDFGDADAWGFGLSGNREPPQQEIRFKYGGIAVPVDNSVSPITNDWHHFTGVVDVDAGTVRCYVDAELDYEWTGRSGSGSSMNAVTLGNDYRINQDRFCTGFIDDFRVYDIALAPDDISAIHAHTDPLNNTESLVPVSTPTGASLVVR